MLTENESEGGLRSSGFRASLRFLMSRILRLGSIGSQEDKHSMSSNLPQLNVEFEVGRTLTLRPTQVVRGSVILTISDNSRTLFASSIKIKFRGEETSSTKAKDSGSASGSAKRVETARTIYFECSYVVWSGGNNGQVRELVPGMYRFEFALKLPPVNFPPSIEGPKGNSIRYVWQPVIEGAGGTLIEGPEIVTPFIPISFAPPDQVWNFKDVLYNDKKPRKMMVEVEATLPRHVFSPGEELNLALRLTNHSNGRITCVQCSLRKHYEGPLDKELVCEKHERSLVSTERRCDIGVTNQKTGELEFSFIIPRKFHHVPPTFSGRHLRVYYTLRCVIQAEMGKLLTKMQFHEVIIPIAISSFPHISQEDFPENTSYPSYTESRFGPYFFDPNEDFPPSQMDQLPYSNSLSAAISCLQLDDFYNSDHDSSTTHSPYLSENDSSIINDNILETNHRVFVTVNNNSNDRTERTIFTTTRLG
ncbi:7264_t:CDS:2 [Funneliformis geosporum]|nr:7264_t:CDS:2 [Funneliformis geosporum]